MMYFESDQLIILEKGLVLYQKVVSQCIRLPAKEAFLCFELPIISSPCHWPNVFEVCHICRKVLVLCVPSILVLILGRCIQEPVYMSTADQQFSVTQFLMQQTYPKVIKPDKYHILGEKDA